jgi:hypothetical protein
LVFDSNDGTLSPCRIPWQPARSPVSMATLCFELATAFHSPHLYRSPSDLGLNNVREADDARGRTADERLHQTLLRSHQKMPNSRRQLCRALDTLVCFGRWRTLTIYLGISLCNGRLGIVLICHRFAKLGIDQLLTYASLCWRTRLLSPLSSTPSSTLNYKPMLAHSRTATEQRSRMDEHAAAALVAAKKKCSVSDKDVVKTRA